MGEFALGTDEIGGETPAGDRSNENACIRQIRGGLPSDLDPLMGLIEGAMEHPWTREQVAKALEGDAARTRLALGAASASIEIPLAFVLARRVSDLLEIDLVGVAPDHRRRGIAHALLVDLIDTERAQGLAEARLELAATNEAARALYEALGFVVVGRRSRYYPDGNDALLLTKAFE